MSKNGKISSIKKDYTGNNNNLTMKNGLAQKGYSRIPGTGVFKYPYKDLDGRYRTGLDDTAPYIDRIADTVERDLERKRVKQLKEKLERAFGKIDLSPTSEFWNGSLAKSQNDTKHVQPIKLMDGDNLFDFSSPIQELAFAWLRVHPTIASSLQAYERGEYPAETMFYVVDDAVETNVLNNKKKLINKAIVQLETMSVEKRKKVARQLGLPVTDDTGEQEVYNLIDNVLKQTEFKNGKHMGLDPVKVFTTYAGMQEQLLHVKDVVKQALLHSILRTKQGGKVFKGEYEMATDEDVLVKFLMNEEHQTDLLTLEQELKGKKLASV